MPYSSMEAHDRQPLERQLQRKAEVESEAGKSSVLPELIGRGQGDQLHSGRFGRAVLELTTHGPDMPKRFSQSAGHVSSQMATSQKTAGQIGV